jgi:hypothetical protein
MVGKVSRGERGGEVWYIVSLPIEILECIIGDRPLAPLKDQWKGEKRTRRKEQELTVFSGG